MIDQQIIYREAKVIDNNDTTKKGGIKVRIFPDMLEVDESLLPWAFPLNFGTGLSSSNQVHKVPEINSFVRIIVEDKYFRRIRYIFNDYVPSVYSYDTLASKITSISEKGTFTYPQPNFEVTPDNYVKYHDTSSGEIGEITKSGAYTIQDPSGNFTRSLKLGKYKLKNDLQSLKDILEDIQALLKDICTPGTFISATAGSPVVMPLSALDLPKATLLATKLNNLLG